jgi:homopolymeric O-antigen transport system ATP-binding protein
VAPAIDADRLSKEYHLGRRERYLTLRDAVANAVRAPFALVKRAMRTGVGPDEEEPTLWALKDVSFSVGHGEVIGIVGRNGAGKSTLLKILSRVTEPTSGRARLNGRVGSLLEVGTGFHPELTGRENVYLNAAILGMRRAEIAKKFDQIVEFAEIERFIDTPVKRYSSGMQMRLAFSVAAHLEPEILLVDEVLAVGDAAFQRKCLGKMNDVSSAGRTILFVSHNMTAVQALCQRALWLEDGRVREYGDTHGVVVNYLRDASDAVRQRVWNSPETAPGNDQVRLQSVRIVPPSGRGADQLDVHTPFSIEFGYWNLSPGTRLNLSVAVHTQEGTCVFVTTTTMEESWHGKPFPGGLFRSVCAIPGDLLNDNVYRLTVMFVKDSTVILHSEDSVLSFEIHDSLQGRDDWYGKWLGVIRPSLRWTTEHIEESVNAPVTV